MLLRKHLGVRRGAAITIEKRIPVAAGLGGGSANAAATLLALARLWERDVDHDRLHAMAAQLGADVPFFLRGGTQLARGIGEQLRPLSSSGGGVYLIITPPLALSTAWVYERLRMGLTRRIPKVNLQTYKALLSRFPERDWPGFNRLGDAVFPAFPQLHRLYLGLQDTDPRVVMLSGSGPTLFAVYSDEEQARRALETVRPRGAFTWIGCSTRQGVRLLDT
jgi:4-diphosphocytidyl-2-C-methyl-D-erythritol kinase